MAGRGGGNFLLYGGLVAAGGVGYYFYQAGGDPKVAQNKAERTSHTRSPIRFKLTR